MVTTYANLVVKKKGEKKRKEELYPLALALTLALCPWLCSHFVHEKEPKLQAEIYWKSKKKRKEELYSLALPLTLALSPWLCSHFVHEKEHKLQAEICQQQQHKETLWVRVCDLSLPKPGITTITAHKQ